MATLTAECTGTLGVNPVWTPGYEDPWEGRARSARGRVSAATPGGPIGESVAEAPRAVAGDRCPCVGTRSCLTESSAPSAPWTPLTGHGDGRCHPGESLGPCLEADQHQHARLPVKMPGENNKHSLRTPRFPQNGTDTSCRGKGRPLPFVQPEPVFPTVSFFWEGVVCRRLERLHLTDCATHGVKEQVAIWPTRTL